MQYTKEERLDIGRQIYDGELSKRTAAEKYEISEATARDYMRLYRDANSLPPKQPKRNEFSTETLLKSEAFGENLKSYEEMTKEELILELAKSRIAEARLKKGYEVKGDGTVIRYSSKNTK